LDFIREFIKEFLVESEDIASIVNTAYVRTLKDFHGWVVRGVFAVRSLLFFSLFDLQLRSNFQVAVKSLPTPEELLEVLSIDAVHVTRPNFVPSLMQDLQTYLGPLTHITKTLHDFYTAHDLDSKEQV
jgi:pleckstrin family protein A (phosphoinositide binding specific) protein 8